jgi:hypothetical protein
MDLFLQYSGVFEVYRTGWFAPLKVERVSKTIRLSCPSRSSNVGETILFFHIGRSEIEGHVNVQSIDVGFALDLS